MELFLRGVIGILMVWALPAWAEFKLQQPIDCTLNKTCLIQQFMDHDAGDGVIDFHCDSASYDGHKGTDFRVSVSDMKRGVNILAAADGVILGVRDGMADVRVQTDADRAAVAGKECGNGMVVRHADGWETQYCHMKNGSVQGEKGAIVRTGQVIGQVGLSGRTQFAHLHLSVRKDGAPVDPFAPAFDGKACAFAPTSTLWDDSFTRNFTYQPTKIAQVGMADAAPSLSSVMDGAWAKFEITSTAPIVVYGLAVNGQAGDVMVLSLEGPTGTILNNKRPPLIKRKAQWFGFAGKQAPDSGWPSGAYVLRVEIQRDGTVLHRTEETRLLE